MSNKTIQKDPEEAKLEAALRFLCDENPLPPSQQQINQAINVLESLRSEQPSDEPRIRTSEAIEHFFKVKEVLGLKTSTEQTNRKRLKPFADKYEFLPLNADTIREYLEPFTKKSPRYLRNMRDTLAELYNVAVPKYHLPLNPIAEIGRPHLSGNGGNAPHPLKINWLPNLLRVAETDNELAALYQELGAGWRPGEFRSIEAIDVRRALTQEYPIIDCHSKELARGQTEQTPTLPEALDVLSRLTPSNMVDHQLVIRNKRKQPMGEKAHTTLIYGLYRRARIPDEFIPYDLRDTFASLVLEYSNNNYWLMERLLRHAPPGEGKKYARYPMAKLYQDLEQLSPLRIIQRGGIDHEPPVQTRQGGAILSLSGEGGTRTHQQGLDKLLIDFLDGIIYLGDTARQIKSALDGQAPGGPINFKALTGRFFSLQHDISIPKPGRDGQRGAP